MRRIAVFIRGISLVKRGEKKVLIEAHTGASLKQDSL
jgi:hypothetical protein